jgi:indole-3-acetate monooxygenase
VSVASSTRVERRPPHRAEPAEYLLAIVDGIGNTIRSGEAEAEFGGTLPAATVAALSGSGLLAMKLPHALGGAEADPISQVYVIEALAALDSAAAWCTMVGASAIAWPGAFLADDAIADIFAGGRVPCAAVVVQPTGVATPVDGGYRVSGHWVLASGIRHAEWVTAGVRVTHSSGTPRGHLMTVFRAADVQIDDDWHAAGLQGTGSCGFSVVDLFVPAAFSWEFSYARPRRGGALYRLGWPGFVAHEPAAFALGIARRALDAMRANAAAAPARAPASRLETLHHAVGESEIRLHAARALVLEAYGGAWDFLQHHHALSETMQAELRSVAAYTTETAFEIAAQAFRAGGSGAVYTSSVLQRCLRDISVAGQHWLAGASAHETYGRLLTGADAT